jgi:hypothetical protein
MNKKTIEKMLTKKHLHLMKSIDDEDVRRVFDKEAIITGGAIASLLLGEKVNDYDYYFTSKEACLKVANYYVEKFKKENKSKIQIEPSVLDDGDRVKIVIKSAGIASEKGDDGYKYFEARPEDEGPAYVENMVSAADNMDSKSMAKAQPDNRKPYRVVFMTSNAITLANDVQLVMRFYGSPDEIHKNYDFAHCTNYWKSSDGKVYLRQEALESLLSRTLDYQGSLYPVCSIIRTRKFIRRGWHINAGQYLKMAFQVSELNLTDVEVLEEQLIGVDTAYFQQLIDIIKTEEKNSPNFSIDSNYVCSIVDKIF